MRVIYRVGLAWLLLSSIWEPSRLHGEKEADKLLRQAKKAAAQGQSAEAVRSATAAIEANPQLADAHYLRGREHFRLGKIDESVKDFEHFVRLRPDLEPRQWELGISYYYAGQFEKGAKQFELYQTFYDNDVENSVWRYLCVARDKGVEKARETILLIQNDPRVPMMHIYDMFRAKLSPEEVLVAARAGQPSAEQFNRRLFYAHLYIGLFYEAEGNRELTKQHIVAARKHRLSHYMWDVARHHATLLSEKQ